MTDNKNLFADLTDLLGIDEDRTSQIIINADGAPVNRRTIQRWYRGTSKAPLGATKQLADHYMMLQKDIKDLQAQRDQATKPNPKDQLES